MFPLLTPKPTAAEIKAFSKLRADRAESMEKAAKAKEAEKLAGYAYKIAYASAFEAYMNTATAKDREGKDTIREAVAFSEEVAREAYAAAIKPPASP